MEDSFGKLNLDDMREKFHDAPEQSTTQSTSSRSKNFSQRSPNDSRPPRVEVNDTGDFSRRTEHDLTAVSSSSIPPRGSSKNWDPDSSHNLTNTSSNSANTSKRDEAAIKRKSVPPQQAQSHPESNIISRTADTSMNVTQAPAVTHEAQQKHRHEIIHEKITRDIHIHHYHDVIQPIKQVVIKPARHFTIDEHGNKVRIPAPPGWQPPPGWEPTPEDESHLGR